MDRATMARLALRLLAPLAVLMATSATWPQTTSNPDFRDTAVIPAFHRKQPGVVHFTRILRTPASEGLDLLVVRGGALQEGWQTPSDLSWWNQGDLLGIFLADRRDSNLVYELAIVPAPQFGGRLEPLHADTHSLTLQIIPEKGQAGPQLTFFFDERSKSLRKQVQYAPFVVGGSVVAEQQVYLIADNREDALALAPAAAEYEMLPADQAAIIVARSSWRFGLPDYFAAGPGTVESEPFGPAGRLVLRRVYRPGWSEEPPVIVESTQQGEKEYAFPTSDREKFERLRPHEAAKPYGAGYIGDEIGPHQIFQDRVWFGKTFYGGEGHTGVGGFGFFDPDPKEYTLFEPPEAVDWAVSALLVEDDAVWLGLMHRGEWGNHSGGLLRWDRRTRQAQNFEEKSIIRAIVRCGEQLCLGEEDGPAFFQEGPGQAGTFKRFAIVARPEGGWRVVPRL